MILKIYIVPAEVVDQFKTLSLLDWYFETIMQQQVDYTMEKNTGPFLLLPLSPPLLSVPIFLYFELRWRSDQPHKRKQKHARALKKSECKKSLFWVQCVISFPLLKKNYVDGHVKF